MTPLLRTFVAAAALTAAAHALQAGPVIRWDSTRHDFGAFDEDLSTVRCTFRGVNAGDEPLVIFSVRPNCGCTTTDRYDGREYAPGDSIDIDVTYNAIGRPGRFSKKLMIHSNADPEKQELTISGTVIAASNTLRSRFPVDAGAFKADVSTIMLGEVFKGGAAGGYFKGYNPGPAEIHPEVIGHPEYMDVIIKPETVAPGEQFVISVSMLSGQCPGWGLVTDTISIRPDAGVDTVVTLTTVATVNEDFRGLSDKQRQSAPHLTVDPQIIDLGRVSRTAGPVSRTLTLTDTGRSPLTVRRVYSPDPAVTVTAPDRKIKPGKSATITITADPAASSTPDMINARVTVITNDPDRPTLVVRVIGELTD